MLCQIYPKSILCISADKISIPFNADAIVKCIQIKSLFGHLYTQLALIVLVPCCAYHHINWPSDLAFQALHKMPCVMISPDTLLGCYSTC